MRLKVTYSVVSGKSVEIKETMLPARSMEQYKKRRRPRIAGNSSEKKIIANEQEAVRRLARIINCNFGAGDMFITRKYSAATLPPDMEAAEQEFKKILRRLRDIYKKQTGKKLRYVWVPSNIDPKTGMKTRIHHHLIADRVSYEIIRELVPAQDEISYTILDNRGDHTALAVYLVGNGKGKGAGKKKWSTSQGLEKPIYTEPEVIEEIGEIEAPAGVEVKESSFYMDEETGQMQAYLRYVLPDKPEIRGNTVIFPQQRIQKNRKKRRKKRKK